MNVIVVVRLVPDFCRVLLTPFTQCRVQDGDAAHDYFPRAKQFSAATATRELGVSKRYLVKLLRSHYGLGFRAALRQARIQTARALLERSSKTIKEIAVAAGYSSTSQFDRDFRLECRMTPSTYRTQNLQLEMVLAGRHVNRGQAGRPPGNRMS